MNTQIEDRFTRDLRAAVDGVEAAVGFADQALQAGRRRRRRRTSALVAGSAVAVVAGLLVVPGMGPDRELGPVTGSAAADPSAQLAWARSLPEGLEPGLPMFTDAGLRDGTAMVEVPGNVDKSRPAQRVSGGWLVMLRTDAPEMAPAVLTPDGGLRALPAYRDNQGGGWSPAFVSPDGVQVAYGNRVVNVETLDLSEIPHDPAVVEEPSTTWATGLRISGWTDEGLVYRGAPTFEGLGTEWLLRPDGSTVELGGPESLIFSIGHGAAGYALTYDYSEKSNTCATLSRVTPVAWEEEATHCMGRYLGEALDLSPDGRWLLTDDLPEIWDVRNGKWVSLDAPADVLADDDLEWLGAVGWETDDTLLIPLNGGEGAGKQTIQVVRCAVSTGACEKAGPEARLTLDPEVDPMFGPAPVIRFIDY
ncbi:hypothetical protein [Nocardioides sp. LHG3406-4]|uniref:hypothetical protein n=1 Tax=Nocardioides sp. LHG3406-4 TaxID=2804575 RepID=UPI003CEECC63